VARKATRSARSPRGRFLFGLAAVTVLSGSAVHHFRYLLPFLPAFVALLVPGVHRGGNGFPGLRPASARRGWRFSCRRCSSLPARLHRRVPGLYGRESRGPARVPDGRALDEGEPPARDADRGPRRGRRRVPRRAASRRPLRPDDGALAPSSVFFADWIGSKYETLASWPRERRPRHLLAHKVRYDERGDEGHLRAAPDATRRLLRRAASGRATIGIDLTIWEIDWERLRRLRSRAPAAGRRRPAAARRFPQLADVEDEARHRRRFESRRPGVFGSNRLAVAACVRA